MKGALVMWPAFLFVLALVVRVIWILAVPSKPVGDFAMYLEAATHWLEHGHFDAQFIYMPGYVLLAAAVRWLGGGWAATKLVVALLAAAGTPMIYGITWRLWGSTKDKRSGALAGLLYALWPGGVGVSSVTGTDIPAAMLVLAGAFALVQREAPTIKAALAGACFGLAAWVRAVALPLVPLATPFFWLRTQNLKSAARLTVVATLAASVVLAPWVIRNRLRYGEWFLSDSHGGLTAMVGAYPNADGQFTRALNRTYEIVNGRPWLSEPHRAADKGAYAEAKRWTRYEPAFALGLALGRIDKLLSNERSLLYWPLYRAGVLKDPPARFFDTWRPEIEWATDAVWWLVLWGCVFSIPLAVCMRRWEALAFVPMQAALVGVYVLYFAESRYHLTIAVLAFPGAAASVTAAVDLLRGARHRAGAPPRWRHVVTSGLCTLAVGVLWLGSSRLSATLIEGRRWAVHACDIEARPQFCLWKRVDNGGRSPVKGVFDGVGVVSGNGHAAARTELTLTGGPRRFTAELQLLWTGDRPAAAPQGRASLKANGKILVHMSLEELWAKRTIRVDEVFESLAGINNIELALDASNPVVPPHPGMAPVPGSARLWLLGVRLSTPN